MHSRILNYLDQLIESVAANILLSGNTGLLDGQAGIVIFLYQYSRYRENNSVQGIADQLLDSVVTKISENSELDTAGIALTIYHLMNEGFVEPDISIFEEIDDWLFSHADRNGENSSNFNEKLLTGMYIYRRIIFDKSGNTTLWRERMKKYFRVIYTMLCRKIYFLVHPVFKCSELLFILYLCSVFKKEDYFKDEINLISKDLNSVIHIAMREDDNYSDKYLLSLLMKEAGLDLSDIPVTGHWDSISLMDINHFFLYRYLLSINPETPECIGKKMISVINNEKHINRLRSLVSPNTSGLNGYVAGFAWALLQWSIENEIKK